MAKVTKASMQTRVFPPPTNPRPPNRNAHVIMKWVEARLHNNEEGRPSLGSAIFKPASNARLILIPTIKLQGDFLH